MATSTGRVRVAAGLLALVSLALVFAAALGAVPASLLPTAPAWVVDLIPALNAGINVVAFVVVAAGWYWIRQGRVRRHRAAMGTGLGLFALFLCLYLYRVSLRGPTPFTGPAVVRRFVYLPLLAVHVLLAVVCVPLLYYVALLALTRPTDEIGETDHPRVGRVAVTLWLASFALGTAVYALLYLA